MKLLPHILPPWLLLRHCSLFSRAMLSPYIALAAHASCHYWYATALLSLIIEYYIAVRFRVATSEPSPDTKIAFHVRYIYFFPSLREREILLLRWLPLQRCYILFTLAILPLLRWYYATLSRLHISHWWQRPSPRLGGSLLRHYAIHYISPSTIEDGVGCYRCHFRYASHTPLATTLFHCCYRQSML